MLLLFQHANFLFLNSFDDYFGLRLNILFGNYVSLHSREYTFLYIAHPRFETSMLLESTKSIRYILGRTSTIFISLLQWKSYLRQSRWEYFIIFLPLHFAPKYFERVCGQIAVSVNCVFTPWGWKVKDSEK